MNIEQKPLADLKPYDVNPRLITSESVGAVAESIEKFGFRQPIVVDDDGVIIIGHTRYWAAHRLALETVPVHVAEGLSEEETAGLRLVDNRSGEFSNWDADLLEDEIAALKGEMADSISTWFPREYFEIRDPDGFQDAIALLAQEDREEDTGALIDSQKMSGVRVGTVRWLMPKQTVDALIEQWERETNGSVAAMRRHLLSKLGVI